MAHPFFIRRSDGPICLSQMLQSFLETTLIILISIISGLLLYLSFPPFEFHILSWFSLSPVFIILIMNRKRYQSFLLTFVMGVVLCGFHIKWINVVDGFPFVAFVFIIMYGALFFGIYGMSFSIIQQKSRWPASLIAAALWVSIEFIRSNLSFLSIPWALLGYSQYNNASIIQIASFGSVYAVSFLIVLVNAAIAEGLIRVINHYYNRDMKQSSFRRLIFSSSTIIFVLLAVYLWGIYSIKIYEKNVEYITTVSLIQGNIPQNKKWDPNFRDYIIDRYSELTLKESKSHPDLIIWPETATPAYLKTDAKTYLAVSELAAKTGVPILLGSSSHAKISRTGNKGHKLKNSAFLMDRNGTITAEYNKMMLLPFGEYLPLDGWFPWPKWLVPKNGIFIAGSYPVLFSNPQGNFGVTICWENLFPDLFRKFIKGGALFMVNLTNEGWFGKTEASRQILSMSIFRSVENRVSLLRTANTGISCVIDPMGRIVKRIVDENGNDIMVAGSLTVQVPGPDNPTFYTKYGDFFAITCIILILFSVFYIILPLRIKERFKLL